LVDPLSWVLWTSQTPVDQLPSELYIEVITMSVKPTFFFNASLIFFSLSSRERPSCLLEVVGGCSVDDGRGARSLREVNISEIHYFSSNLFLQIDAYDDGANDNDHHKKYSIQR
jgi:hypothetical protein